MDTNGISQNGVDGGESSPKITTCEMHTCGGPVRIVEDGFPEIRGDTVMKKWEYLEKSCGDIMRSVMMEPRGHRDMYGAIRVQPDHPEADVGLLFLNAEHPAPMCGHVTMSFARYCVDKGLVERAEPETSINIQCPGGLVKARVSIENGKTGKSCFRSVPSFAFALGVDIFVPVLDRTVKIDIGYGGAFYAYVTAQELGVQFGDDHASNARLAHAINKAVRKDVTLEHPDNPALAYLYGTVIVDRTQMKSNDLVRQMCCYGNCHVDRSPCGSGTSGHVAVLHARGELDIGSEKLYRSAVTNAGFLAKPIKLLTRGKFKCVQVEVSGKGYYIGRNEFFTEEDDPLKGGFVV